MRDLRQDAIRQLLAERAIGTQKDLREALGERGQTVDQSTLSRDLQELGVRKVGGRYQMPAETPGGSNGEPDYSAAVRGFLPCGPHMIVVRTDVGQAQPVGLMIDKRRDDAIVATLAGDDTIFLATKNRKTQAVALRRLEYWFGDKRER